MNCVYFLVVNPFFVWKYQLWVCLWSPLILSKKTGFFFSLGTCSHKSCSLETHYAEDSKHIIPNELSITCIRWFIFGVNTLLGKLYSKRRCGNHEIVAQWKTTQHGWWGEHPVWNKYPAFKQKPFIFKKTKPTFPSGIEREHLVSHLRVMPLLMLH